ncbi:MAG: HAMP domain-containing protein [Bacillota bacterium]|nr:HAMP domain-containing protein [Bacillota bacterium]
MTVTARGPGAAAPAGWVLRSPISRWSSLRTKVTGIILALVVLLGLAIVLQTRYIMIPALEHQLQQRAISIARDMAARSADMVLTNDLFALHQLAMETSGLNDDVRYAFIVDRSGALLVHSFTEGFPAALLLANEVSGEERQSLRVFRTEEGTIRDVAVPIAGGIAGTARIGMGEHRLRQTVAGLVQRELAFTALTSLLGLAIGFYYLNAVLVRPLGGLVQSTAAVAGGDLSRNVRVGTHDEIGELAQAFNQMTEQLERSRRELKAKEDLRLQLLNRVITAQEDERRRIARELHDETGQYLTSLMLGLKAVEEARDMDTARRTSAALREMTEEALDVVRDLSLELRPGLLDDLGLVPALQRHTAEYQQRAGIEVDLCTTGMDDGMDGTQRLPGVVELTLYRIVQEALTNVARHSGARKAAVCISRSRDSVSATVEDDGRGFDVGELAGSESRRGRLGLFGMQERASLVGGRLAIESAPGSGTTVYVRLPLAAARGDVS